MSEAPMGAAERRRLLIERDPNAGYRLLLAVATELADALQASQRRELDQPADIPTATVRAAPPAPAVELPPVAQPRRTEEEPSIWTWNGI